MSRYPGKFASTAEPKASVETPTIERTDNGREIFLSPRVIDARSFEEFSATLRDLIARAQREHDGLETSCEQGKRTREATSDATRSLRQSLEQTLRAAKSFDERFAHGEGLIARTKSVQATLETLSTTSEDLLCARMAELERRINSAMGDAFERLDLAAAERAVKIRDVEETIESRLVDGERRARQLEDTFTQNLSELEDDRADKFVRLIDAIEIRLDEGQTRLTEFDIALEERLEAGRDRADQTLASLEARVEALLERSASIDEPLREQLAKLDGRLDAASTRADEILDRTSSQSKSKPVSRSSQLASGMVVGLGDVASLTRDGERIERLLGRAATLVDELNRASELARSRLGSARAHPSTGART